ncbi:hypothetical protein Fmac_014411 [Flemingia macrophylla]|uniref:Uncharacterized protein n=1 Tax=Flemingia macrophylla TaxID=520843 RepID=A0ABD1MCD8_9FABA
MVPPPFSLIIILKMMVIVKAYILNEARQIKNGIGRGLIEDGRSKIFKVSLHAQWCDLCER